MQSAPTGGAAPEARSRIDVVIVGAGFAGIYALHRCRMAGLSACVLEAGAGVGGTWFWNCYPGARCDVQSLDYSYSFSDEIQQEWSWSERYAAQAEILAYINYVVDRCQLRDDIYLGRRVTQCVLDESVNLWTVRTEQGDELHCRFCIMATGCLSIPYFPQFPGMERFQGEIHHTARWPESLDLRGKRVGVIGTGSSGIQLAPTIAQQAEQLVMFQRTPAYSIPAQNRPMDRAMEQSVKANYAERRRQSRESRRGYPAPAEVSTMSALDATPEARAARYEALWQYGGPLFTSTFGDIMRNEQANQTAADFVRAKIRSIVHDSEVAAALSPTDYPIGGKRICVDIDYFQTYNRDNVTLVNLAKAPIEEITATGVVVDGQEYELDVLVLATGFDAMTGALNRIDIRGRNNVLLRDKWVDGPRTYLGIAIAQFPNFFMITGPGSPSVLCNMVLAIEHHVDWVADCLIWMREHGHEQIEALETAEADWVQHVNDVADTTLYPSVRSWRTGANIPGKPRVFMPYVAGFDTYQKICTYVADCDYLGFAVR